MTAQGRYSTKVSRRLQNITITRKLMLIAVLACVSILIFAGALVLEKAQTMRTLGHLGQVVTLLKPAGALLHELEKERAQSVGFVTSGGADFSQTLAEQRRITDESFQAFRDATDSLAGLFSSRMEADIASVVEMMAAQERERSAITALSRSRQQTEQSYDHLSDQIFRSMGAIAASSDNADLSERLSAYLSLLSAKKELGNATTIGAGGFAAGQFSLGRYIAFVRSTAMLEVHVTAFRKGAPAAISGMAESLWQQDAVQAADAMTHDLIVRGPGPAPENISTSRWFSANSAKTKTMKQLADAMVDHVIGEASALHDGAVRTFYFYSLVCLVTLVVLSVLTVHLVLDIMRSTTRLTDEMRAVADGDLNRSVSGQERKDEIGAMAKALAVFRTNGLEKERLEQAARERAAEEAAREQRAREEEARREREEQELQARQREARRRDMLDLADRFERNALSRLDAVLNAAARLSESAQSMAVSAQETLSLSQEAATESASSESSIETVVHTVEGMTSSVTEVRHNAEATSGHTSAAVKDVEATERQVASLDERCKEIERFVSMINDISGQTRMLALNATIEATRAGEAGQGFAVVAKEVKGLAVQTSQMAEMIGVQAHEITESTLTLSHSMAQVTQLVSQIDQSAASIVDQVDRQYQAIGHISDSAHTAQRSSVNAHGATGLASEKALHTGDAADKFTNEAKRLAQEATDTRDAITAFLAEVRAS